MRDAAAAARVSLIRGIAWYGALLLASLAGAVWIGANAASGAALVPLVFAAAMALLLGYYVLQHLRDLGAQPVEREGAVTRRWSRADLLIAMQSYYISVDRTVFRVRPEDYIHMDEGARVRVVHFPHTLQVISLERLAPGA
ncbi:MAG TPA: hypothetical protein VEZ14_01825 [Dehalococcoidia bacterium]|nr:hypothetical protein [Dehalococcoidia bacterium]